jgi:hypothetical protein
MRLPDLHLVGNISPAMMIDTGGTAHVTVIATSKDGKTYAAAEVEFRINGAPAGNANLVALPTVDQPVKGGAILYIEKAGKAQRRDIALLTATGAGSVLRRFMATSKEWKLLPAHVTPFNPVLLVPGQGFSYVLCFQAGRGFFFEPI